MCRPPYGKITLRFHGNEMAKVGRLNWSSGRHTLRKLSSQLDGSQNGYEATNASEMVLGFYNKESSYWLIGLRLLVATSKRWCFRLLMLFIASLCSKCAPKWWRNRLKHNSMAASRQMIFLILYDKLILCHTNSKTLDSNINLAIQLNS